MRNLKIILIISWFLLLPFLSLSHAQSELTTFEFRASTISDNVEENASNTMDLASSDLELASGGNEQTVGIRFNGVDIPRDSTILNGYIQLQVDETNSVVASGTIDGVDTYDAQTFSSSGRNITDSIRGAFSGAWNTVRESFFDDFNRSDSDSIGNGWIEKNPNGFSLTGNAVVSNPAALVNEKNNIVYRPVSEDLLDVEASVEFRLLGSCPGYPQVHVRVQSDTVGLTNQLDSYELWVRNDHSEADVGRQPYPYVSGLLTTFPIDPPLNTTDTFRLRLRASGTDPVELSAFVERFDGTNWQVIGQAVVTDASDDRISSAGSVGFGGYNGTNCQYDNFAYTNLLSE